MIKKILRLGFPILIAQLGMIVVGFADTKMVGLYSTEALASASFVNNLFTTAIMVCMGFGYGLTPLVGALFTQRRLGDIGGMVRTALILNVALAVAVTLVMVVVYFNVERMGQPEQLIPLIKPYMLLYILGILPIALFNVFAQWSFGITNTSLPMWITLGANALNILGNWVLIYGNWGFPELGLQGAGISTLISRWLCPVVLITIFFTARRFREYSRGFVHGRLMKRQVGQINRTSWPVSLQMFFETSCFSLSGVMAGWIGAIELASFQILMVVGTMGFCIYASMANAVSVLVANAAGLNDQRLMRRTAFTGYAIILVMAVVACFFFIFCAKPIIHQFTEDEAVLTVAVSLIIPLALYQVADATQITFANALRGTANVLPMIWIAFVSYVIVGLPVTYIIAFPLEMGIYGIILSFSVSLFLAAVLFLYYFMRTTSRPLLSSPH
ncbi:MAG: MATE family efflux transporter [Bacteroidales bacterium]|nr:MATE family efflux transporter [Bacteroidales bacterium]